MIEVFINFIPTTLYIPLVCMAKCTNLSAGIFKKLIDDIYIIT